MKRIYKSRFAISIFYSWMMFTVFGVFFNSKIKTDQVQLETTPTLNIEPRLEISTPNSEPVFQAKNFDIVYLFIYFWGGGGGWLNFG